MTNYATDYGPQPFIAVNYIRDNFNFNHVSLIDTGAGVSTFPLMRLPPKLKAQLQPTNATLNGIGGAAVVVGKVTLDIQLSGPESKRVKNITMLVTNGNSPVLVGNDVLEHDTVNAIRVDRDKVTFERKHGGTVTTETAARLTKAQIDEHFQSNIAYYKSTEPSQIFSKSTTETTAQPLPTMAQLKTGSLSLKLKWLNDNFKINLS